MWTPTVVLKSWLVFHPWDISWIVFSQNEKLKSNFMLTSTRMLMWLCKSLKNYCIFTFSFTFSSTESPEDISLQLLLSFWLVKGEVQQGLLVLWLVEREGDLMSRLVPGLCVTVKTHMCFRCLQDYQSGIDIHQFLMLFSLWLWTSEQDLGCCGCLQLVEGWVWSTGPGDAVGHTSGLGERLKLTK